MKTKNELFEEIEITSELRNQYERDGYLMLGRTLSDAGLERLREECMAAWEKEKEGFDPDGSWLKNALLPNIHRQSRIVRDFYFEGPLVSVAEALIGPNIKGAASQLTFKMRGNTQKFGWHQDNGYGELDPYNALTTLTALDDVSTENGCLWILPGSHRQEQIRTPEESTTEAKAARKDISVEVDETGMVPVEMRAGESVCFHCWTLHKSDGNHAADRDRRILFMRYADANAVEVYNGGKPRLGKLLRGETRFAEVAEYEADL